MPFLSSKFTYLLYLPVHFIIVAVRNHDRVGDESH